MELIKMAGRQHMSQEKISEMIEYGKLGFTYKDIAKEFGCDVSTVARHLGPKQGHTFVNDKLIARMKELRDHGLSNSQIAIELNASLRTIEKYIGKQKKRAEYGSIVAHATGESFVKYEEKENKMENKLKIINSSVSFQGKNFTYKACTDGRVRITSETGVAIDLDRDSFAEYVSELLEVGNWLECNMVKESPVRKSII
jgi:DNA-binding CsgD family transcriptional regulator